MKEALLKNAFKVMEHSYAPYSNFHVGSSVLLKDGTIVTGANVENASYGATNCAERSALFACYSQGYRKEDILGLAIVADGDFLAGPCGVCRQVISELVNEDVPLYMSNGTLHGESTIGKLLPMDFNQE